MNLNVEFRNYKLLENEVHEFEGGNIYYVEGPNKIGKTTFIQGLAKLATGVAKGGNNVTFGKADGSIKGTFKFDGADGGNYIVKYDFADSKNTFTIIDPKTNVHKSTSRNNIIADIFKYNLFTVDDWFGWGLTAEGRRKQAEIILGLFPEAARKEYEDIDNDISPKFGVLYKQRTEVNKDYQAAKSIVDQFSLTSEEEHSLTQLEKAEKLLYEYEQDLEKALANNRPNFEEKLQRAHEDVERNQDSIQNIKNDISDIDAQIAALIKKKSEYQEELATANNNVALLQKNKDTAQADLDNCEPVGDIESIRKRISDGKAFIDKISDTKTKQKNYKEAEVKAQLKFSERDDLDSRISAKRDRKIALIEENKLPIDNIAIEDGECFYVDGDNYVPFTKDSVSYATGGMIVIKLMAHLNHKLPIWLVGSAESYDNNKLPELQALAEKHNGIIFMDRVVPDAEQELTINVLEKPE